MPFSPPTGVVPAEPTNLLRPKQLIDVLESAVQHKPLALRCALAGCALSLVVGLLLPKGYRATALILPPQQNQGIMDLMMANVGLGLSGAGDLFGKGSDANRYVGMLASEAVCDSLIDRFKLMDAYRCDTRSDTYRVLQRKASVSAGKKDGIITITVEDRDPERAAQLANAYVGELDRLVARLKETGAGNSNAFYAERLAQAKGDLARAEEAMSAFRARNTVVSVPNQAEAAISGLAQMQAQLLAQEVQLAVSRRQLTEESSEVKNLRGAVSSLKRRVGELEAAGTGGAIPGIGSLPELGQQYLRLMREVKIQETLVDLLTKQYQMTQLAQVNGISGVKIIQPARAADKEFEPKLGLIAAIGGLAGGALGLLYSLLRHAAARSRDLAAGGGADGDLAR